MARKKKTRSKSSSDDPATQYARDVVEGRIVAGPHVRAACQRHLTDLETGNKRGLVWDVDEVFRVIAFFRDVLTVEQLVVDDDGQADWQAVPFELEPSQAFIVGSLMGWKNASGYRRFRRGYVEIGKGNGKSPLAAGLGHYMMLATRKLRAEVYSAATDKDQAAILFRDAVEMWRRSPPLMRALVPSGQNPTWQLTHLATSSFFKPISSEKKGKSGIRPYCALIDEVHEHPDNSVIEMLRAGTKGNRDALIFEITNSGFDRTSVCWSEHEYSVKVCNGDVENDAWFSYVCALDEGDEPFEDEACWIKANPLLGVSIQHEYIREQVEEAKGMPDKENYVRRLNFCQWTDAEGAWINRAAWVACETEIRMEDYGGEPVWGGLDLSFNQDLSAAAWVFKGEAVAKCGDCGGSGEVDWGEESRACVLCGGDGELHTLDAFLDFWKPGEGLQEAVKRDRVPYDLWAKNGHLRLCDSRIIQVGPIAQRIGEVSDRFDLQCVAYDRYRYKDLEERFADYGVTPPMVEHPQGFRRVKSSELWFPGSFQHFENAIITGRLRVRTNPVLRWNVASTVVRHDENENRVPDKRKSFARIDGVVASTMAVGAAITQPREPVSPWEDPDFSLTRRA